MNLGKFGEAAADYTTAISNLKTSPEEYAKLLESRMWAYLYDGYLEIGMSDAEQFIKLKPYDSEGYFAMGYALSEQKKFTEAIAKYSEAIKMNPSHSMAFNNRGYDKFKVGLDINDALKDVNKSIELNPDNTSALSSRAEINIKLAKYTGAIMDLNKSIKIRESGFDYYLRGNAKIKLSDKIGACSDWSKAGELNEMKAYDQIAKFCK